MRIDVRPWLLISSLVALILVARGARGQPVRDDTIEAGPRGGLFVAVGAAARVESGATALGFFVALGGRFDVIVDRPTPASRPPEEGAWSFDAADDERIDEGDAAGAKRAPKKAAPVEEEPAPVAPPPAEPAAAEPAAAPRRIDGRMARGLVRAALRADRGEESQERLDGLATRARVSALLPEVRVRIGHDIDQGESLAPTEYDPGRVTATGATSLWVEGRATFQLDRLVFADEEVQIERLRADRAKEERALTERILGLVEKWQAAELVMSDPGIVDPDVRAKAEVARIGAECALDVLTAGWFGAHLGELRAAAR